MKRSRSSRNRRVLLGLLSVVLVRLVAGCSTNEENLSERPWNAPQRWETGLPYGMTEERR